MKDYEGDGALLYFGSIKQATRAAIAIQDALLKEQPADSPPIKARLSLNVGEVVVGLVGACARRSLAFVGQCVNLASRRLKHVPPAALLRPERLSSSFVPMRQSLLSSFRCGGPV